MSSVEYVVSNYAYRKNKKPTRPQVGKPKDLYSLRVYLISVAKDESHTDTIMR